MTPRKRPGGFRDRRQEHYDRARQTAGEPVVYPVLERPAGPTPPSREIPMTITQFVVLGILFILIAWAGASSVAYGVVELSSGGEQGPPGAQGEPGPEGAIGPRGPAGDDAAMEMIKRLGSLFAVQQKSSLQGGAFIEFNDPEIGACVQYIITGEPGVHACPGFSSGQ